MSSPSFACPWCGAVISHDAPGTTFECPFCRAKVTAPWPGAPAVTGGAGGEAAGIQLGPHVQIHGNVKVAPGGGLIISRKASEGERFTVAPGYLALAFQEGVGLALVGVHAPDGEPAKLRAYDAYNKQIAWEALLGHPGLEDVSSHGIVVRNRNVYVALQRNLIVLDLKTGRQKFVLPLSDEMEEVSEGVERGAVVLDPFPPDGRGAALALTVDNQMTAFDRDSGQVLWRRALSCRREDVRAVPASCVVVAACEGQLELINPAYAEPVAVVGKAQRAESLRNFTVNGNTLVVLGSHQKGDDSESGVFVIEAPSGRVVAFEKIEEMGAASFDESVPVFHGGRVYAMTNSGESLHIGPRGGSFPCPLPDHAFVALAIAGPTLFAIVQKKQGTSRRRLLGLDPASLAIRFDLGELGTEPDERESEHLQTDGYALVVVGSPNDDEDTCELRAVDTTSGRQLWQRPVGEWYTHAFLGGYLAVTSRDRIAVLRPDNGRVVAEYPAS